MRTLLIISFLLSATVGRTQISIDSFVIYDNGSVLDSFYLKITSNGQNFSNIVWSPAADLCGTIPFSVRFTGCETGTPVTFDTLFTYGFMCTRIWLYSVWDPSSTCSIPAQQTLMDSLVWDPCTTVDIIEEDLLNTISIAPNPSHGEVYILNGQNIDIIEIGLFDQTGKRIKQIGKLEEHLDLSGFEKGIYFIRLTTPRGIITRRLVLN